MTAAVADQDSSSWNYKTLFVQGMQQCRFKPRQFLVGAAVSLCRLRWLGLHRRHARANRARDRCGLGDGCGSADRAGPPPQDVRRRYSGDYGDRACCGLHRGSLVRAWPAPPDLSPCRDDPWLQCGDQFACVAGPDRAPVAGGPADRPGFRPDRCGGHTRHRLCAFRQVLHQFRRAGRRTCRTDLVWRRGHRACRDRGVVCPRAGFDTGRWRCREAEEDPRQVRWVACPLCDGLRAVVDAPFHRCPNALPVDRAGDPVLPRSMPPPSTPATRAA